MVVASFAKELEGKMPPRYTVGALESMDAFYEKYKLDDGLRRAYLKMELVERLYLRAAKKKELREALRSGMGIVREYMYFWKKEFGLEFNDVY